MIKEVSDIKFRLALAKKDLSWRKIDLLASKNTFEYQKKVKENIRIECSFMEVKPRP